MAARSRYYCHYFRMRVRKKQQREAKKKAFFASTNGGAFYNNKQKVSWSSPWFFTGALEASSTFFFRMSHKSKNETLVESVLRNASRKSIRLMNFFYSLAFVYTMENHDSVQGQALDYVMDIKHRWSWAWYNFLLTKERKANQKERAREYVNLVTKITNRLQFDYFHLRFCAQDP